MSVNPIELLIWARGPGFSAAVAVCVFGLVLRGFEILSLGRKTDLAPARAGSPGSGARTVLSRFAPAPGMLRQAPLTVVGGYVFHLGWFAVLLLFVPHVEIARAALGIGWPGLPSPLVDALALASMGALALLLADRLIDRVKRLLSDAGDYLAWGLSFLPLLTGYLALHHLLLDYTLMLALHVLSAELLLALLPFTRLTHALTSFLARWYTGKAFGRRGVAA
jgi:nitrate reductase gamma subunit